jgi:hypothetical protein
VVVQRWEAAEVKWASAPPFGIGGAVEEWGLDLELPCLLGAFLMPPLNLEMHMCLLPLFTWLAVVRLAAGWDRSSLLTDCCMRAVDVASLADDDCRIVGAVFH